MIDNPSMHLLAQQLLAARQASVTLGDIDNALLPTNAADAYQVQQLTIAALGGAGAFKVGAKTPLETPLYSPIPATKVWPADQDIAYRDFSRVGLELEIAFRFKSELNASHAGLSDDEILGQIQEMMVAVEIVDSRYTKWPHVDKLAQLADLQGNGALIVGDAMPYDPDFDFMSPSMSFACGPQLIFSGNSSHTAGDPRRLLVWWVRKWISEGQVVTPSSVVTTGSYTGIYSAPGPNDVVGEIAGIGRVAFSLV
jgi:2-keto-4-pentenoate hydratase